MILKDKTIIITGATKGIGRAIAVAAAKKGANLVLSGRDQAAGDSLMAQIGALGGQSVFLPGDLTRVSNCQALADMALKCFGRLDGLVNYAGTVQSTAPLTTVSEEQFTWIMDVNFKSAFFVTQAAINAMPEGGSIVFMGSLHAYGGEADRPAYACSKGAMHTLYKHVARNYAASRIRANWVTIGWIATPGEVEFRKQKGMDEAWLEQTGEQVMPMGRLQQDEDYVDGVLYLLSDGACQTSGSELFITGGFTL
ncbi:MAG: SDR family oxidoreductase [Bacillota bacterium]|nr:SDR family oxidoreductase [Bacillota bacterium]